MYSEQPQQPPSGDTLSIRGSFNLMYAAISGHVVCFTPFLRHSFGSEALGWNGFFGLLVLLFYITATQSHTMVEFMIVWFVALIYQRIRSVVMRNKGWIIHSYYEGTPWLGMRFPVRSENSAKVVEPFVCLAVGPFLWEYDVALGNFVFVGFFSLMLKHLIDCRIRAVAVQRMHDAEIEQRAMLERFQGKLRDF